MNRNTLFSIAALALIACGGGDDDTDGTTSTPTGTTTGTTGGTTGTSTGTTATTTGSTTGTTTPTASVGSIIDVAEGAGDFTTLLAAVDAAGLTDTLATGGPFTVMAPTDDAFAALPKGTVDALLNDIPALTDILLYHVIDGEVPAGDVVTLSLAGTLNGSDIRITLDGSNVLVGDGLNNAMVTVTDVEADNGIIHIIDAVMLPPGTVTDIAVANPDLFSTLTAAVVAAGLDGTLADETATYTVFAPTDSAFAALPAGTLDTLLADPSGDLTNILLYHVAADKYTAADVISSTSIPTLYGDAPVTDNMGVYEIAGAPISITDIPAKNGVIHVIDAVMLP